MTEANANLATRYLGLELPCPIVVGSCGLTATVEGVQACAKAGAGAVTDIYQADPPQERSCSCPPSRCARISATISSRVSSPRIA